MFRLFAIVALLAALATPAAAAPRLERVVLVVRHGIRPPTQPNAVLAKYADRPWPDWPVPPGELTPHGGLTVKLVADTVGQVYRREGLLPAHGCAPAGEVSVWADGADERTRETGRIFAAAVEPGCGLEARWSAVAGRDPIFFSAATGACPIDRTKALQGSAAARNDPRVTAPMGPPLARLQAILAPRACDGGAGTCFERPAAGEGAKAGAMRSFFPATAGLAEDILLEYVDGKPMSQVGWGRASVADIDAAMPLHEKAFALLRDNAYLADRGGAAMARVILGALAGQPVGGGPLSGPRLKLLALAGHDTNLAWMGGVFGLDWTLPGNPDFTAPSTTLAFELWRDGRRRYVRPVIYYETLRQLRTLSPATAERLPLRFAGCASGPMGSCPLSEVRRRVLAEIPDDCGALPARVAVAASERPG